MTWAEWVDSGYNVNQEYFLSGNLILKRNNSYMVAKVIETDTINNNYSYTLMPMSSGGTN